LFNDFDRSASVSDIRSTHDIDFLALQSTSKLLAKRFPQASEKLKKSLELQKGMWNRNATKVGKTCGNELAK
jgi:hypothetical protein